jgi:hypothetical protein
MSTTTSLAASVLHPFSHDTSSVSPRGTRIYWASTWLQSETPNGRYEIEKLSGSMWVVTHHQVIAQGRDKVTRRVSGVAAKTKREAIAQAESDCAHLESNVMAAILNARPHTIMAVSA